MVRDEARGPRFPRSMVFILKILENHSRVFAEERDMVRFVF